MRVSFFGIRYFYLLLQLSIFLFLVGGAFVSTASAAQDDRLSGWAWSDNIGWISMNCTNDNSCDTVDYGVTVSGTGGNQPISGWAWSDNIGWIDFSNVNMVAANRSFHGDAVVHTTIPEPYCNGSDKYQTNASDEIGLTGGSYTCSNTSNDDSWDGVISISDTAPIAYGPVADATDDTADGWNWEDSKYYLMDGYAWGGDVVGWVKFSCQDSDGAGSDTNTCGTVGYGVFLDPFYMSFSADDGLTPATAIAYDGSFNHTWTLIPDADIASCTAPSGVGSWTDVPAKSTSPSPLSQLVTNVDDPFPGATSTLICTNTDGKSLIRTAYIYIKPPKPTVSFTAYDYNIGFGASTTLLWTTKNIASCVASAGDAGWNGAIATGTNRTYGTDPLVTDTTYNMTCTSDYPAYYSPVLSTLEVTVQRLIVDFYAEDGDGNRITDPDELFAYTEKDDIKLVWETEFATGGCVASGDWSGTKVPVNAANDIVDGDEMAAIPDGGSFTYTLTCDGELGQHVVRSVTIRVTKNPEFSEEITNDLQ